MNNLRSLVLTAALLALSPARAEEEEGGQRNFGRVTQPAWQQECGSCHVPYPPQMLASDSWRAVMTALDEHFGTDATLDAATTHEIEAFLVKNSPRPRTATAKPVLRITEMEWFRSEHRKVPAATVRGPKVGSLSRCDACHTGATQGDYSERGVRLPR
jgi:hypothetical protein